MTKLKVGDRVRYARPNDHDGLAGEITGIYDGWDEKICDLKVIENGANTSYPIGSEVYGFYLSDCIRIEFGKDVTGEKIDPEDIIEGDRIRVVSEANGIKKTIEAVVGWIGAYERSLLFYSRSEDGATGIKFATAPSDETFFLLDRPEQEKISEKPKGHTFEMYSGANTIRYTKVHEEYWVAEVKSTEDGKIVDHFTISNEEIDAAHKAKEEIAEYKRKAVALPPTGRYL